MEEEVENIIVRKFLNNKTEKITNQFACTYRDEVSVQNVLQQQHKTTSNQ